MASRISLCLDRTAFRQDSKLTGTINFDGNYSDQSIRKFSASLTLRASLHTSIPSSSGVKVHADRSIYCSDHVVDLALANTLSSSHSMPFSFTVPSDCPVTMSYQGLAKIQHELELSITDLSRSGACLPLRFSEGVQILPTLRYPSSKSHVLQRKKVTCTTDRTLIAGKSFFLQFSYPKVDDVAAFSVTLQTIVNLKSGSLSFAKETERLLKTSEIILRHTDDGNKVSVLEVECPESIESSIEVSGLRRHYVLVVHMTMRSRPSTMFSFGILVSGGTKAIITRCGHESQSPSGRCGGAEMESAALLLAYQESFSSGSSSSSSSSSSRAKCINGSGPGIASGRQALVARPSDWKMNGDGSRRYSLAEYPSASLSFSLFSVPRKAPVPTLTMRQQAKNQDRRISSSSMSSTSTMTFPSGELRAAGRRESHAGSDSSGSFSSLLDSSTPSLSSSSSSSSSLNESVVSTRSGSGRRKRSSLTKFAYKLVGKKGGGEEEEMLFSCCGGGGGAATSSPTKTTRPFSTFEFPRRSALVQSDFNFNHDSITTLGDEEQDNDGREDCFGVAL